MKLWLSVSCTLAVSFLMFAGCAGDATKEDSPSGSRETPSNGDPVPAKSTDQVSAGTKAGDSQVFGGDLAIDFRWCPPGEFKMGSPASEDGRDDNEDQVDVTLSKGFWLGSTEVTQAQFERVMGTTPWEASDKQVGSDCPATYVNWDDATAFCAKLTELGRRAGRLPDGWAYRLPTEAEWEYACRAGTKTVYSFGNDVSTLGDYAWFRDNDIGKQFVHAVGTKKPNPWGLSDMHGNVNEWCSDWYDSDLVGGRNPKGPSGGSDRVYRGGGGFNTASSCRSAYRHDYGQSSRYGLLGFRIALSPPGTGGDVAPSDAGVSDSKPTFGTSAGEPRTFADDLAIGFRWCPPGEFTMGSPASEDDRDDNEDQVDVTLSQGFWLGRTEVTQGLFERVMGTTPWEGNVKEGANYPATYVDWGDATAFCAKLTERERRAGRLPDGWAYRLPTEAEWEYACRAGTKTVYSFGNDVSTLGDYAWCWGNAKYEGEEYAHAVGTKKPNPWGLSDVHGNVWEWCSDWYDSDLPGGRDPKGQSEGLRRVSRGGSWDSTSKPCRSAYRYFHKPSVRNSFLGFRLALSP